MPLPHRTPNNENYEGFFTLDKFYEWSKSLENAFDHHHAVHAINESQYGSVVSAYEASCNEEILDEVRSRLAHIVNRLDAFDDRLIYASSGDMVFLMRMMKLIEALRLLVEKSSHAFRALQESILCLHDSDYTTRYVMKMPIGVFCISHSFRETLYNYLRWAKDVSNVDDALGYAYRHIHRACVNKLEQECHYSHHRRSQASDMSGAKENLRRALEIIDNVKEHRAQALQFINKLL